MPIAWARFTGTEDDSDHTTRRTAADVSEEPNIVTNYNITSIDKSACGTYTVTITNCPSSAIMVVGDVYSWGTGTDGTANSNETFLNLNLEIVSTSGGDATSGSSATIQFKTRNFEYFTLQNFREARLVFYAK